MKKIKILFKASLIINFFFFIAFTHGQEQSALNTEGDSINATKTGKDSGKLLNRSRSSQPTVALINDGSTGIGTITLHMLDTVLGSGDWKVKITGPGVFKIRDQANSMDVIQIEPMSLANAFYIKAGGNIGLGLTSPNENLHLSGAMVLGSTTAGTPAAGTIEYGNKGFRGYNGSEWIPLANEYYVGQLIGTGGEDGVVFWVDHTGQHGLICANTDIHEGTGIEWNLGGSTAICGASSHWDGAGNTAAIIATFGAGAYAAKICDDYATSATSAGDWYLPAYDEASKLYHARYEVDKALNTNSFDLTYYWTSTEEDGFNAWHYRFHHGTGHILPKNIIHNVRPIRAF